MFRESFLPLNYPKSLLLTKNFFLWTLSDFPYCLYPTFAGTVAFTATLSLSTSIQHSIFGISTSSLFPIPTFAGFISVSIASIASHITAVKAYEILNGNQQDVGKDNMSGTNRLFVTDQMNLSSFEHNMRVCVLGMLVYKCLGGRFRSISPSSYTSLGSFSGLSVPATNSYATSSQRRVINRIGLLSGCHTCGSRMILNSNTVKFHADHMPPLSVAKKMNNHWFRRCFGISIKYRFYPQCIFCSSKQGEILSQASRQLKNKMTSWKINLSKSGGDILAYNHWKRLRYCHITGAVISSVTVRGSPTNDIICEEGGNYKRFLRIQNKAHDFSKNVIIHIKYAFRNF